MQIGINLMEYLSIATAVAGALWARWFVLQRRAPQAQRAANSKRPLWVSYGADLFGVLALMLFCRVAIADWHEVPSGSMEPTLRVGDRILVNKLAYGPRLPFTNTAIPMGQAVRGDVVVFRFPEDVSQYYVKRLIGLPGDLVTYRHGAVTLNGQAFELTPDHGTAIQAEDRGQFFVQESTAGHQRIIKLNEDAPGSAVMPSAWMKDPQHCIVLGADAWQCKVPDGRYLMMGDNRDNSLDSRVWGFLDSDQVLGKASRVVINFSDMSRFWRML